MSREYVSLPVTPMDAPHSRTPAVQPVMPQHIHDYGADGYRRTYCGLTQGELGLNAARLEEVMCQA